MANFAYELERLINKFCLEEVSNTPDHVLANYMLGCLAAFNTAVTAREEWYGHYHYPGGTDPHKPEYDPTRDCWKGRDPEKGI